MHHGHVESTRFLRNPLDVLAQQIVAVVAHPPLIFRGGPACENGREPAPDISLDALLALVRSAAPFAD